MGVEKAGNSERTASKVDVGTHLSEQEVITDAFLNNEANVQEIERVKIRSNKNCIGEDLAKENMVHLRDGQWLIELKKSSIQCLSCLQHVFEGTLICGCGKLMRPNKDVMNRFKEAFEIQKAPYHRTSLIVIRGSRCGPNPWQQHHHKARDALRSVTNGQRAFTSMWDRWQHDDIKSTGDLSFHTIGSET